MSSHSWLVTCIWLGGTECAKPSEHHHHQNPALHFPSSIVICTSLTVDYDIAGMFKCFGPKAKLRHHHHRHHGRPRWSASRENLSLGKGSCWTPPSPGSGWALCLPSSLSSCLLSPSLVLHLSSLLPTRSVASSLVLCSQLLCFLCPSVAIFFCLVLLPLQHFVCSTFLLLQSALLYSLPPSLQTFPYPFL